jgi:hypothetical protein
MKRVVDAVKNGTIDYVEMGNSLLGDKNSYGSDNLRKAFYVLQKVCDLIDDNYNYTSDDILKELELRKFEIQKERKKLQTINSVYQENARLEGRNELYWEQIADAIKSSEPIKIPDTKEIFVSNGCGIGCLVIADAHYGRVAEILDLDGSVINKYDPEEFENRMWLLLEKIEEDRSYNMYNSIFVKDLGDVVEGILRSGTSLLNLKYGNIKSAIKYARFMSQWLCSLSKRLNVPVSYSLSGGNHDILRILDSRPQFEDENIAEVIVEIIQLQVRLASANDKKINVSVRDYNAVYYDTFFDINTLSYHGSSKDMEKDLNFFENLYNVKIDILFAGHFHTKQEESVGFGTIGDKEIIRVPSICSIDDHNLKIRKASRAGAKFIVFTETGKDFEKTYYLN